MDVHSRHGHDMAEGGLPPECIPDWIRSMGTAVWISGPNGRLIYVNRRAESLFGIPAERALGRACFEVVGGYEADGRPLCQPKCPVSCRARAGEEIEPVEMLLRRRGRRERPLRVVMIGVQHDGLTCVVHCALDDERHNRIERYLSRVATRTTEVDRETHPNPEVVLTRRELQILKLLAEDETLHSVAANLHLSYATVRNHVQHVLSKLGVHSIIEAVACYLLWRE